MKRLEGKKAVVTGGNSGIGLASAKRMAEEGARVLISGRDPKTLASAAAEIGAGTLTVQADLVKLADIDKVVAATKEQFGKIDVLFANAGVFKVAPFATTSEATFDEQFAINVKAVYFTVQKMLPLLNDGASVILNSSVVSSIGAQNVTAYAATKAAVRSFARTMGAELVGRKIRVNAVAPGPIETPIFARTGLPAQVADQVQKSIKAENPMGRFGSADEVAAVVAFLASPESAYITGIELNVDGGFGQF
jgi:NAD(P)-dependent dehydrogenase (short-subunit alcohol dehydrogenase family)